jgi:ABC-type glycerol-3-phosphate transport system permease component
MMLESHFPSLFQIISGFFCAADLNLMTRWAGLPLPLLGFGLGGWLLGHFYSCFVYRGSLVLLGFGPLVDH